MRSPDFFVGKVIHRKNKAVNCVENDGEPRSRNQPLFHRNTRVFREEIVDNVDKMVDNSYPVSFSVDNAVDG